MPRPLTEPPVVADFDGVEIYPMPMFATLAAPDAAALSAWYQAALGFTVVFSAPPVGGQPSLVHLRRRKYQDLLIVPAPAGPVSAATGAPTGLTLSFDADGEVDALAVQARGVAQLGASSVEGP